MRFIAVHLLAAGSLLSSHLLAQAPEVSLAVSDEIAPAGGVVQIKVFLTEPKPIVRTGMAMDLNATFIDEVLGVSAAGGATGVARYSNGRLRIELNGLFAVPPARDYPIVTIAIRLQPFLPPGARIPVQLDLGNSFWLAPGGQPYAEEARPGSITVGESMYISNVLPGGGTIPPGGTFRITGAGFASNARVQMEGARPSAITPTEITMTAREPVRLDGERIRIANPPGGEQVYFSYLRGIKTQWTAQPALEGMVPVFSTNAARFAIVPLANQPGVVTAVGLQNPTATPVTLSLVLRSPAYMPLACATVTLGAHEVTLRSAEELFGSALPAHAYLLQVNSPAAFQLSSAAVGPQSAISAAPALIVVPGAY